MNLKLKLFKSILLVALADLVILTYGLTIYEKGLSKISSVDIVLTMTVLAMGIVGIVDSIKVFKKLLVEKQYDTSYSEEYEDEEYYEPTEEYEEY